MLVSLIACAISMATDCLGIVLELNGVIGAAPLAFIIPPLCVMKLRQEPIFSKDNIIPIAIATFGSLVASVGFVMAIVNFEEGNQCSHGQEPAYCLSPDSAIVNLTINNSFTQPTTPFA